MLALTLTPALALLAAGATLRGSAHRGRDEIAPTSVSNVHQAGNLIARANGPVDEPLNEFKIRVEMGKGKNNVGRLVGPDLYNAINNGLMELCPEGRGECFDPTEGGHVFDVEYFEKGKVKPGVVTMTIKGSSYHGPASKELRNLRRQLMISTIAGAYEAQSKLTGTNCYATNMGDFCNVGDHVIVNIEDKDYIHMELSSPHAGGQFDCVGSITSVHGAVEGLTTEYTRAYFGAYFRGIDVLCPNKEVTR